MEYYKDTLAKLANKMTTEGLRLTEATTLPISGNFQPSGRYQLEGNAGGV